MTDSLTSGLRLKLKSIADAQNPIKSMVPRVEGREKKNPMGFLWVPIGIAKRNPNKTLTKNQ